MENALKVTREFFGIRYRHADFGARPDQTHPELVCHPLSEGQYIVQEHGSMADAFMAAHAVIGTAVAEGPRKGNSIAGGGVEVFRAVEHDPVTEIGLFGEEVIVTMKIMAVEPVNGIPHFASTSLSSYHPVNGVATGLAATPKTEKIQPEIEYSGEHPWATVRTNDGNYAVSVSLTSLSYAEDGRPYLLGFYTPKGEPSCETRELRMYLEA